MARSSVFCSISSLLLACLAVACANPPDDAPGGDYDAHYEHADWGSEDADPGSEDARDSGVDPVCVQTGTRTYDDSGRVVAERENAVCRTFQYDGAGRLTRSDDDHSCDGSSDFCRAWTYDAEGRMTGMVIGSAAGSDCVGSSLCQTWTYEDRRVTISRDDGCDGLPSCDVTTYDDAGRVVSRGGDRDCDGVVEDCSRYSYDSVGTLVSSHVERTCGSEAGIYNCWTYTQVDERTRQGAYDNDCDGQPDAMAAFGPCIIETTVDGEGRLIEERGLSCDGTPVGPCRQWEYDGAGRERKIGFDLDCDHALDTCTEWVTIDP